MKYYSNVLVMDFQDIPEDMFKERFEHYIHNDTYIKVFSEFNNGDYGDNWHLTIGEIYGYWRDQQQNNNYEGTMDNFIIDYGLQFEMWLLEQEIDLRHIDLFLIKVSW